MNWSNFNSPLAPLVIPMAKYLVGDRAHTMYSYTHTQPGPSSHVHRFHPHGFTARPVARQITPPRSTVTTSRTVETIGGNRYRSRSYRMPASPPRSSKVPSAPSASRGRPRFALCRGSPPSPPPLEVGANGMSSLASLIEFPQPQVLSHVQVGGKKKKNRLILPGFWFTISKVEAI